MSFFDSSPILGVVKTLFLFLNPIGQIILLVRLLIGLFGDLEAKKNAIRDILPKFAGDALFGERKKGGALGPPVGARAANRGIGAGTVLQNKVGGQIGITLGGNVPKGTKVNIQQEGPVELDFGFAGALQ